jgi:hypothetical protein
VKVGTGHAAMFWLFNETNAQLDSYANLVKENKALDGAFVFAKYVINSRLCDILDEHPGTTHLPCNGATVRNKAEKLRKEIQRRWETRDEKPHIQTADLTEIRAELAALRSMVSGASEPHLRVIDGGNS